MGRESVSGSGQAPLLLGNLSRGQPAIPTTSTAHLTLSDLLVLLLPEVAGTVGERAWRVNGPVWLEVSHTVFQAEAEQGYWGNTWRLGVWQRESHCRCLQPVLRPGTAGNLLPRTAHTHRRAHFSAPTRTQSVFRRVLIQCKLIDVKVYSPCEIANSHSNPNAIIISCL